MVIFRIRRRAVLLSLTLVIIAACSNSSGSGNQGGGSGGLDLKFVAPADGAQIATPFEVQVQASVALGAPESGRHHVHLYYDTTTPTTDESTYDKVYGSSFQVTRNLGPGRHTILAALANADHSLAGGPMPTITITVGASQSGGASQAPSGSGGASTAPSASSGY